MNPVMLIIVGLLMLAVAFTIQLPRDAAGWYSEAHKMLPQFTLEELNEMGLEEKVGKGVTETIWTSCDDDSMKRGIILDGRAAWIVEASCGSDVIE